MMVCRFTMNVSEIINPKMQEIQILRIQNSKLFSDSFSYNILKSFFYRILKSFLQKFRTIFFQIFNNHF